MIVLRWILKLVLRIREIFWTAFLPCGDYLFFGGVCDAFDWGLLIPGYLAAAAWAGAAQEVDDALNPGDIYGIGINPFSLIQTLRGANLFKNPPCFPLLAFHFPEFLAQQLLILIGKRHKLPES
ncbi:MAG TPA: hypothetical protein ENJ82_03100 [Bacteroidetes bacterium]|nr:hypothetical protein [Bacteroidota bacterium]